MALPSFVRAHEAGSAAIIRMTVEAITRILTREIRRGPASMPVVGLISFGVS